VVVVVPAFAQRDDREDEAVAEVVARRPETAPTTRWAMASMQAVPWKRTVVLMKKAETSICGPVVPSEGAKVSSSAPIPKRETAKRAGTTRSNRFRPRSFGEARQVADLCVVGREVPATGDPTDVRPTGIRGACGE
jgi:hypothetical protein